MNQIVRIRYVVETVNTKENLIMAAIDDLRAALNALATEAVTDLEAVIAKISTVPPDDTAALQVLTQQATDTVAKLKADMTTLSGAPVATPTTPPAPPTPSATTA